MKQLWKERLVRRTRVALSKYTDVCDCYNTQTDLLFWFCRVMWTNSINSICPKDFTSQVGPTVTVPGTLLGIFRLVFTLEILEFIVEETNKYALQCLGSPAYITWSPLTVTELESFMGFMIMMGLVRLPSLSDYWSKDPVFNQAAISSRITRTRFLNIKKYLHFADNQSLAPRGTQQYDKLGKIRPVLEMLGKRFQTLYNLNREVAIDEAMIKFKGRSAMKQYLPLKPIKRGLKVWVLADSHNGYVSRVQVYTGKDGSRTEEGLGANVVQSLCENLRRK